MVHALKEAWRLLIPHGIMIDQRPLSVDAPLDIISKEENKFAGMIDTSPTIKDDIASDNAIESVRGEGLYKELQEARFQVAYYWKTVRGMMADLHERWIDDVIIDENVIQRAYQLFRRRRADTRVRILLTMKLVKYEKQS